MCGGLGRHLGPICGSEMGTLRLLPHLCSSGVSFCPGRSFAAWEAPGYSRHRRLQSEFQLEAAGPRVSVLWCSMGPRPLGFWASLPGGWKQGSPWNMSLKPETEQGAGLVVLRRKVVTEPPEGGSHLPSSPNRMLPDGQGCSLPEEPQSTGSRGEISVPTETQLSSREETRRSGSHLSRPMEGRHPSSPGGGHPFREAGGGKGRTGKRSQKSLTEPDCSAPAKGWPGLDRMLFCFGHIRANDNNYLLGLHLTPLRHVAVPGAWGGGVTSIHGIPAETQQSFPGRCGPGAAQTCKLRAGRGRHRACGPDVLSEASPMPGS